MLQCIIAIIVNALFFVVLNLELYTDRAVMPNGETRVWHRSPIGSLDSLGGVLLFYLLVLFAAVSVITSLLVIFGVKSRTIKKIQLVSTIIAAVLFFIIMVVTMFMQPKYG